MIFAFEKDSKIVQVTKFIFKISNVLPDLVLAIFADVIGRGFKKFITRRLVYNFAKNM
jgi:hypothetical protein